MADDRHDVEPGDRVVLVIVKHDDAAEAVLARVRARGFKGVVALRGETGPGLAHEYKPDAIVLDVDLTETTAPPCSTISSAIRRRGTSRSTWSPIPSAARSR